MALDHKDPCDASQAFTGCRRSCHGTYPLITYKALSFIFCILDDLPPPTLHQAVNVQTSPAPLPFPDKSLYQLTKAHKMLVVHALPC